jgi:hypothetical protein
VAASHELVVVERENWGDSIQELGMVDNLHSILRVVKKLAAANVRKNL